jgi:hypothetical protein
MLQIPREREKEDFRIYTNMNVNKYIIMSHILERDHDRKNKRQQGMVKNKKDVS